MAVAVAELAVGVDDDSWDSSSWASRILDRLFEAKDLGSVWRSLVAVSFGWRKLVECDEVRVRGAAFDWRRVASADPCTIGASSAGPWP